MRDFQGDDGELIVAFTDMLDQEPSDYPMWWHEIGLMAAIALGGSLHQVRPDYGQEAAPGTVGFEMNRSTRPLLRSAYIEAIALRMVELVRSGVDEAFLVRSLVVHLDEYVEGMSDVARANEARRATRDRLLDAASTGVDDEERGELEHTAGWFSDVSEEEQVSSWARRARWTQAAEAFSRDRIGGWVIRAAERRLG